MTFQHSYSYGWALPLLLLGMGPGHSSMEVAEGTFRVSMGWSFRMAVPLAQVSAVRRENRPIPWRFGIGVHGWAGEWAVNASRRNHVVVTFDRPQRAWLLGVPIRVRVLHLSPSEPDRLVGELSRAAI